MADYVEPEHGLTHDASNYEQHNRNVLDKKGEEKGAEAERGERKALNTGEEHAEHNEREDFKSDHLEESAEKVDVKQSKSVGDSDAEKCMYKALEETSKDNGKSANEEKEVNVAEKKKEHACEESGLGKPEELVEDSDDEDAKDEALESESEENTHQEPLLTPVRCKSSQKSGRGRHGKFSQRTSKWSMLIDLSCYFSCDEFTFWK